jgi:hypothetical protein
MQAVEQREVDDSENSAERNSGLWSENGERV